MNKHLNISAINNQVIGETNLWLLDCSNEGWDD